MSFEGKYLASYKSAIPIIPGLRPNSIPFDTSDYFTNLTKLYHIFSKKSIF